MDNCLLHLEHVYVRYEPYIKEGLLFLFNKDTGEILEGNFEMYEIVKLINGKNSLKDICSFLSNQYNIDLGEMESIVNGVVDILKKKGFVRIR